MHNYYGHDFNKKRYALFGQPIDNSYSAHIYRQLFSINNIVAKYSAINSQSTSDIKYFMDEFNLAGGNITSPLKRDAMEICDHITDDAKSIGGVNTIVRKNNKIMGFNTDWEGVLYAINQMVERFPKMELQPDSANILIIGAGPAATAAVFAIQKFYPNASITITNRTAAKAEQLATATKCKWQDMDKISNSDLRQFELIIVATANKSSRKVEFSIPYFYTKLPVDRMGQASWAPKMSEELKNKPPEWEHSLYKKIDEVCGKTPGCPAVIYANYSNQAYFTEARKKKHSVLSGVSWLIGQALAAFEYFYENDDYCRTVELRDEYIDAKLREEDEANILLIGFSGCGKTDIAPKIAQKTGRTWVDTDAVIKHMTGEQMEDLLTKVDEDHFRTIEAAVIRQYASVPNCVIATGAGAICNPLNQQTIHMFNCKTIYLYADLKTCLSRIDINSRPYLRDKSEREIEEMYNARKYIYFDYADFIQRN